ncbi:MAG: polysaccharide biosynthesis protein [Thermoleophilia bacterium]
MTGRLDAVAGRALALPLVRGVRPGMEANALILMASSLLTGALGIAYWIVAEQFYPTEKVGQAAAMMSTATMLSSLACLSLGGSYQRFLPIAGARTRMLIVGGMALTGAVALLLGGAFVLIGVGGDRLYDNDVERLLFPLIVAVLTAYALLDPILTGLRRAGLVAAKNVSLSVAKIVPLPLLAFTATGFAIAGSWAVLALIVTAAVLLPLLRGGLDRHDGEASQLPPVRQLWAFQGASLAVTLVQTVTPLCLPLIVLAKLGADYSAYYNLVAALGVAVSLLRANVLASYVVEASAPDADHGPLTRRMIRLMVIVCLACAAGLALGGPVLLWMTGEHYAHAATSLVLVMAIDTLLGGVTAAYAAIAYVTRRLGVLVASQVAYVALTVVGALLLVSPMELLGVGVASLAAQAVSVAIVALPLARHLRGLSPRAEAS